jgi:hypothetical protein
MGIHNTPIEGVWYWIQRVKGLNIKDFVDWNNHKIQSLRRHASRLCNNSTPIRIEAIEALIHEGSP